VIVVHLLVLAVGVLLALATLGSALKTVVLPQEGFPRLSQAAFAVVHRLMVRQGPRGQRTAAQRGLYAPVALVTLPLIWMILIALSFMCIFWSTGSLTWQKSFEVSTSSLTTLGFSEPTTTLRIVIAFIEATIGLGLVALLISYLPTIYSAYNNRERGIILLGPLAGAPPTVAGLLFTLQRTGALDQVDFWRNQTDWAVDLEQTHTAFPILTYFPEAHPNLSWVATLGTVLDTSAVMVSVSETDTSRILAESEKGPLMLLVFGVTTVDRVARGVGVPLPPAPTLLDLTSRLKDQPPDISISRREYVEVLDQVRPVLGVPDDFDVDGAWRRFAWFRSSYDLPLRALAGITGAPAAPWSTDRAARVGRPRLLRRRPLPVDWVSPAPAPGVPGVPRARRP
jgi:hypothetical protein